MNNAINPADMGTTGLVDYVLDIRRESNGYKNRYNRIRKAVSIIRARFGAKAIPFFCKAVWAKVGTNIHDQRAFRGYLGMFGFEANT